ncbi:response regulator [Candidatus Uabimicrobium sp. HlEnr_7]|uniref:response regulator n=1 Tax=Candidatus Uabimicrobium helgolandensis TaxID=3095367 RepID=UPI003557B294
MSEGKVRILAIDDSLVTLKILKKTLKETEFEIVGEVTSGEEGLVKFDELNPDLVLLDIIMPGMDGIQTLEHLVQKDENVKAVMVSSMGAKEKVMESLEKGAKNFVMKPYEKGTLIEVLKKVLNES